MPHSTHRMPTNIRRSFLRMFVCVFAVFATVPVVHAAGVIAESTFDNGSPDFDGWTAVECTNFGFCPLTGGEAPLVAGGINFSHSAIGGSPLGPFPGGGNLQAVDPGATTAALFNAPAAFTSALAQGLILSFDLKINGLVFDNDGTPFPDLVPLLYLDNGAAAMLYAVPEAVAATALNTWASFSLALVPNGDPLAGPGGWFTVLGADDGTAFNAIFAGSDPVLRFWGELTIDAPEADGVQLDNVRLSMVPLPAALPLMLTALAGLGWFRRRG